MKTSELTGAALDYAVAKCEGYEISYDADERDFWLDSLVTPVSGLTTFGWLSKGFRFSTDWAQGGPLIEKERIGLEFMDNFEAWSSSIVREDGQDRESYSDDQDRESYTVEQESFVGYAPTPLIAAMRVFVASRLGNEVDVPEELE